LRTTALVLLFGAPVTVLTIVGATIVRGATMAGGATTIGGTAIGDTTTVGSAAIFRGGIGQQTRVSPHESVTAVVDGATITITYGRPSMRGRTIFGALVPYGRVWCPGADEATTLDSSKPLKIGALAVPAGPHTIWMLPTADAWTLVVSKEPSGFHTRYHPDQDLGRVPLEKRALDARVEQLTFAIQQGRPSGGAIVMTWEATEVAAPFSVVQ
jgi:Protein of unknown function (DUF2911)